VDELDPLTGVIPVTAGASAPATAGMINSTRHIIIAKERISLSQTADIITPLLCPFSGIPDISQYQDLFFFTLLHIIYL
jgi:hypothetical protein